MRKKYFATNIVMQLQFTVEHFLNLELFSCLQLGIFVYFSSTKYIYTTHICSTYLKLLSPFIWDWDCPAGQPIRGLDFGGKDF